MILSLDYGAEMKVLDQRKDFPVLMLKKKSGLKKPIKKKRKRAKQNTWIKNIENLKQKNTFLKNNLKLYDR